MSTVQRAQEILIVIDLVMAVKILALLAHLVVNTKKTRY